MNKKPIHFALLEVGVKEVVGAKHNERIIAYHSIVSGNFDNDETPWCSSFVNYCFFMAGDNTLTGSAASQSWKGWGFTTRFPTLGDIVVFTNKINNSRGHVGFYVDHTETHILVLGGNQGNEVSFKWFPKNGKTLKFNSYKTWP